jgi:phenylalanyl-tRNA synthetase beta chain
MRHPTFHPGRSAYLQLGQTAGETGGQAESFPAHLQWITVAVLGEVHPEVAGRFELTGRTYLLEMDLERLFAQVPEIATYTSIPRYPPAERDLAIVVGADVTADGIAEEIRASGGALIQNVRLFDLYTGEGIPEGKKSLAFALTYQSPERTLTSQEIERGQSAILEALRAKFGARRRE